MRKGDDERETRPMMHPNRQAIWPTLPYHQEVPIGKWYDSRWKRTAFNISMIIVYIALAAGAWFFFAKLI